MKNNNIKKVMLALALAAVAVGPNVGESYATESTSQESNYYEVYDNFQKAISDAKAIKNNYKYINADYSNQRVLDNALSEAELLNSKVKRTVISDEAKTNMAIATGDIRFALSLLNGEKATLAGIKELLDSHQEFIDGPAFKNATKKDQQKYLDAYNLANRYYILNRYDESAVSKSTVFKLTMDLKDSKETIENAYAPTAYKEILKEEIALADELRNDADKYTEKSFETFKSALRLAETSIEDQSTIKTAAEYKEIADTLRSARLSLVKKQAKNEKLDELIAKLEKAIDNNKIAIKSGETLLEIAPKTVAPVKDKLLKLIKDAKETIEKSEQYLNELKGIKG